MNKQSDTMLFGESLDLNGKSILITGGTGSFGRHFVRTVLRHFDPLRVVILSRDEHKQYDMLHEFNEQAKKLRFFIGDVRDAARLEMAFRGIDYVIHTAALKHVPVAEYNPFECVQTNIIGAENVVGAAIKANVKRVIALSTDKACNPVNLYGASKLASDKIFSAAGNVAGHMGPTFGVVRYGNVLGSRGSVIPLFRKLIEEGCGHLPITDPRMTRFWITLEQGVHFVLSCMQMMRGGELFVPKIPSMRVVDLATALAPDLPTEVIGIRPGEKLHEVMVTEDDARNTLELSDRYVIEPSFPLWTQVREPLSQAQPVADNFRYDSKTNDQWLTVEDMSDLLETQPGKPK